MQSDIAKRGEPATGYGRNEKAKQGNGTISMHGKSEKLHAIPTNIITGFLGVGKTTAILSLLNARPANERWAVLVNEFGEIGIDGSLFHSQHADSSGVFIREVPGGCMCCVAGLPMHIALNQLLAVARPHRLLIEPTGLGHPKEVLQVLSEEHYQDVLAIQQTITLVDARKLSDARYTSHDTFNQQIDIADIVVGNKQDLYQSDEQAQLDAYVQQRGERPVSVVFTERGILDPALLKGASTVAKTLQHAHSHHHHNSAEKSVNDMPLPECGYISVANSGEGYESIGWRFAPNKIFSHRALYDWLCQLPAVRIKAVMITDEGVLMYNRVDDTLTVSAIDECAESRLEIIATLTQQDWQQQLLSTCLPSYLKD